MAIAGSLMLEDAFILRRVHVKIDDGVHGQSQVVVFLGSYVHRENHANYYLRRPPL